jgi:hypothetical protein
MSATTKLSLLIVIVLLGAAHTAVAQEPPWLVPPVDASISQHFDAPSTAYGPGHRGIDFDISAGALVRSAAAGTVKFAGSVAGERAVTVVHAGGLQTTYSMLSELRVSRGDVVERGTFLGTVGRAHQAQDGGLHFGAKLDGAYVDPVLFFGPLDLSGALHLAPLVEQEPGDASVSPRAATSHRLPCRTPATLESRPPAPNNNVAVAVAGIGSETARGLPLLYTTAFGPEALGYDPNKVYYFSYAGNRGPRAHAPYETSATYQSLVRSGRGLRQLLQHIAHRHPGSAVDLFAHSQGGVVARLALLGAVGAWTPGLPPIEHVVTLATPHQGAPLAALPEEMEGSTFSGSFGVRLLLDSLGRWASQGGPIPNPRARAVEDLAPGSRVFERLSAGDTAFGTRWLSLAAAGDAVVPAPRSNLYRASRQVVSPGGLNPHGAIVRSEAARASAYAFLRDAASGCRSAWEAPARALGAIVDFVERNLGPVYRWLDDAAGGWAAEAVKWGATGAARGWRGVTGAARRMWPG